MRGIALLVAVSLASGPLLAEESKPDCTSRPPWCEAGYICVPTPCAAESAAQLFLMTSEVEALKKKRDRKWKCAVGPGVGVYLQSRDGHLDFDGAPLAGALVCGLTF